MKSFCAIGPIPRRSADIRALGAAFVVAGLEVGGDVGGVKPQPGTLAVAQAPRAELVGVVIDPGAINAPLLGDLRGGQQPPFFGGARPSLGWWFELVADEAGDPVGEVVEAFGVKPDDHHVGGGVGHAGRLGREPAF